MFFLEANLQKSVLIPPHATQLATVLELRMTRFKQNDVVLTDTNM